MNIKTVMVVDIGNTSVSFACARAGRIFGVTRMATAVADALSLRRVLAPYARKHFCRDAIVCSVVPRVTSVWMAELQRLTGRAPMQVHAGLRLGVELDYPRPATIGADRLANACGAAHLYGSPVIVADFGTALTFDIVVRNSYVGGIIVPGLPLMSDYLAEKTALLPKLRLDRCRSGVGVIGRSTRQAMAIGARLGYQGMVREIFSRLRREIKARKIRFCATGGYAGWALAGCGLAVHINPTLTLYGISRIYELNRRESERGAQA